MGGALERRVLFENDLGTVYPNLYVMLCAPPGVGKTQAIDPVREMWRSVPDSVLRIASDDMTKAGMMDELEDAPSKFANLSPTRMDEYRSLLIAASEFSTLMSQMDQGFMANLTALWDGLPEIKERKRSKGKSELIVGPIVSILAGAQPAMLMATLPPTAWDQGFMARFIMVYSESPGALQKIASKTQKDEVAEKRFSDLKTGLTTDMRLLTEMMGIMEFTPDAEDLVEKYNEENIGPAPTHSRLQHYNRRRRQIFLKLCIISSASYGHSLRMTVNDVERAVSWMHEAEVTMPDVFAAMVGKSDADLLDELHGFVYKAHAKLQKPIPRNLIWHYLSAKVPSDRIVHILNTAVKAGLLRSEDLPGAEGTAFSPLPKTNSFLH